MSRPIDHFCAHLKQHLPRLVASWTMKIPNLMDVTIGWPDRTRTIDLLGTTRLQWGIGAQTEAQWLDAHIHAMNWGYECLRRDLARRDAMSGYRVFIDDPEIGVAGGVVVDLRLYLWIDHSTTTI